MEIRLHDGLEAFGAFGASAAAIYHSDPVKFTAELTILNRDPAPLDPLLLTVWEGGQLIGAAMQTPPYPLLCSGLPEESIDAVVAALASLHRELVGVRGIHTTATRFADSWQVATGHAATVTTEERLYRLGALRPPASVDGTHRLASDGDDSVLRTWWGEFHVEALGTMPSAPRGRDPIVLWSVGVAPVSMAMVRAPAVGVSRIGPVYTPPVHRGRGYGSAATAAAAQWALRAGAIDVVLFTDLANAVSNAIYRRIGFEPVADSVRIDFTSGP